MSDLITETNNETQEVSEIKGSAFSNIQTFENAQRMATALSKSSLVPQAYQGNIPNTMVAMEMAVRIGISPLMVMQNLDIIQGKPSWRSSFIIAALNSCGRFSPLRFKYEGEMNSDEFGCRAYATDLETGEKVYGTKITWKMVRAEGWDSKRGSKWKTMPELMFQYRSAAFFGRVYAPEILTGMYSVEENIDINAQKIKDNRNSGKYNELKELFEGNEFDSLNEEDKEHIERVINNKEVLSYDKAITALKSCLKDG